MKRVETVVKSHIRKSYPQYSIPTTLPSWLRIERWKPSLFLESKDHTKLLAVDFVLSGTLPRYQYTKIVRTILEHHKNLRVIIITLEKSYQDNPEIEKLCRDYNIGLKIILPDIGIQTIVRTDLDPVAKTKKCLPLEDGWFPSAIINKCKGLKRLSYYQIIDDFIAKVQLIGNHEQNTKKLVCEKIDTLLRYHPSFKTNFGQFMKLSYFEELLKLTDPKSSDHVFHSFRVFLAGCPVINEFYDKFFKAQKPFCKMDKKKLSIEYIWFLTSIFHDIGRPKEGAKEFIQKFSETMDDVELEYSIGISDTKWKKDHNIIAKRVLGSLGAFVVDGDLNAEWDSNWDDSDSIRLSTEWINMYSEMRSHAIISAFDFLGDIFEKAIATDARKHRPFIVTHAAPAALSIMLHDWKVWEKMRKLEMIPVNMSMLPMAALLIYIDTWDNYKRRGPDPLTFIKEYCVNQQGAIVKIEWDNSNLMEKDEIGYVAYRKAITNLLFKLDLKYGLVGTV